MNGYVRHIIAIAVFLCTLLNAGFLLPALISAKDSYMVMLGLIILVINALALAFVINSWRK